MGFSKMCTLCPTTWKALPGHWGAGLLCLAAYKNSLVYVLHRKVALMTKLKASRQLHNLNESRHFGIDTEYRTNE